MIHGYHLTAGYATKLPLLPQAGGFTEGLNILFGPNGCGKTTLLNILAAYCSIPKAGWSRWLQPVNLHGFDSQKKIDYYEAMGGLCPSKCRAEVAWDGVPTFHNSADMSDSSSSQLFANKDQITSDDEEMALIFGRPSQGQLRLFKINKVAKVVKSPPDLFTKPENYDNINSVWQRAWDAFFEFITERRKAYPDATRKALLWDEPDRSLDIPLQADLWGLTNPDVGLPTVAKYAQVIVATHSPFALFVKGANVIDMKPGYAEECRALFKRVIVDYTMHQKRGTQSGSVA